jgi:hypothetical protein
MGRMGFLGRFSLIFQVADNKQLKISSASKNCPHAKNVFHFRTLGKNYILPSSATTKLIAVVAERRKGYYS